MELLSILFEFSVGFGHWLVLGSYNTACRFTWTHNGSLRGKYSVRAGKEQKITITSEKGRLSDAEITRMVAEAEEFVAEDARQSGTHQQIESRAFCGYIERSREGAPYPIKRAQSESPRTKRGDGYSRQELSSTLTDRRKATL